MHIQAVLSSQTVIYSELELGQMVSISIVTPYGIGMKLSKYQVSTG